MFFDFAVQYTAEHTDIPPDFEVEDELYGVFSDYLAERDFTYRCIPEIMLANVESSVVKLEYGEDVLSSIGALQEAIEAEKKHDLDNNRDYVERALRREIVTALWGEDANYQYVILPNDPMIQQAIELIGNRDSYLSYLEPSEDH